MGFPGSVLMKRVCARLSGRNREQHTHTRAVQPSESDSAERRPITPLAGVGIAFRGALNPGVEKILLVRKLVHGSAAHRCGRILPGDLLLSVDGHQVEDMEDLASISQYVIGPLGSEVRFVLKRGTETFEVTLKRNMLASTQPLHAEMGHRRINSHLTGHIVEDGANVDTDHRNSSALRPSTALLRQLYSHSSQPRNTLPTEDLALLDVFDFVPKRLRCKLPHGDASTPHAACSCPFNPDKSNAEDAHADTHAHEEEGEDCVICLEPMRAGDRVCAVPCAARHEFHVHCIHRWLALGAHTCPCDKCDIRAALAERRDALRLAQQQQQQRLAALHLAQPEPVRAELPVAA